MITLKTSPIAWFVYLFNDVADTSGKPPYDAVATIVHINDRTCSIRGMCAHTKLTFAHLRALHHHIQEQGYLSCYVERPDGHPAVPLGKLIEDGDFEGMFRQSTLDARWQDRHKD